VFRAAEAARRFCNVVDDPRLCSFIMPAIIDRDPVTIAVASGGASPVLSRWVKGIIESQLPIRLGELGALMGRWRARVRAAMPSSAARRSFWESLPSSRVAAVAFASGAAAAERAMSEQLDAWAGRGPAIASGEAYLVGAGPGSPDLLTLRGRQLLSTADVVLYDRLVNPAVLEYARQDAELISVGKTPGRPSITQRQLNRLLIRLVTAGKRVCRLKGGDPMIFGRGGEELAALAAAGLPFQVVPGVSAAEGCAAYAGIPLTLRGVARTVVLTTAHTEHGAPLALAPFRPGQTLAVYMGVAHYHELAEELIALGYPAEMPAAVVENGSNVAQRVLVTTLQSLAEAAAARSIATPALLLVGDTVRAAERYAWFAPERVEVLLDELGGAHAPSLARVS
jgi:uroporphyrin-III C-methyltransferase/precorrin-2 dehydrogenase/sirohydrochlorin ferrochelatase